MAHSKKYADLPDLDSAPDTYETPELTEAASTIPTSTVRSPSSEEASDDAGGEDRIIDRRHLRPGEARAHFTPANADRRRNRRSDSITRKRRAYAASERRLRRGYLGVDESEESSDEDLETPKLKLARLLREAEELKAELEEERASKGEPTSTQEEEDEAAKGISNLCRMLEALHAEDVKSRSPALHLATQLNKNINRNTRAGAESERPKQTSQTEPETAYTIQQFAAYEQSQALPKVADFEARLTLLEKLLGTRSSSWTALAESETHALLPGLEMLSSQFAALSETSPSSIDSISRRVRQLTQEAERLEEMRRAAKMDQDHQGNKSLEETVTAESEAAEVLSTVYSDEIPKIKALYGTLGTIDNLAPLLPTVLERLRTLHVLHAQAGAASQTLDRLEKAHDKMDSEIVTWRGALEKLEVAMKQNDAVTLKDMTAVEELVQDLEMRITKLDQATRAG